MGRRRTRRNIAVRPEVTVFKPQGVPLTGLCGVILGLDGLEALRLVDAEGLSQEEAAQAMGVSRPTVCRILNKARAQVARALSQGWAIRIEVGPSEPLASSQEETYDIQKADQKCGFNHQQKE